MDYMIRRAVMADAAGISQVIIAALRQTNAADYDAATIARVEQSFSEARIADLLEKRLIFVAADHDEVVATASLEDAGIWPCKANAINAVEDARQIPSY